MVTLCTETCHVHKSDERWDCSHFPRPGEKLPRPCPAKGCRYAHADAAADFAAFALKLNALLDDSSKGAARRLAAFRTQHANTHNQIKPGEYGQPFLDSPDMLTFLIDYLHGLYLNLPKGAWKHAILNNCPDGCRELISTYLKMIGHPLDTRKKDDGRQRESKWYAAPPAPPAPPASPAPPAPLPQPTRRTLGTLARASTRWCRASEAAQADQSRSPRS